MKGSEESELSYRNEYSMYLAGEAIKFLAHLTPEEIDHILIDAPAWTIGCLAVVRILHLTLCLVQATLKELKKKVLWYQLWCEWHNMLTVELSIRLLVDLKVLFI